MSSNRGPRVVLALGILAGLIHAVVFTMFNPEQVGIATDTYYYAAKAMLAGEAFYTVTPPAHPAFSFRYPPLFIIVFIPHALLGSPFLAYVFQSLINLGTVAVFALITIRFLERHTTSFSQTDRVLVGAYSFLSVPMLSNLIMGQVNVQLALAVALGVVFLETGADRWSGAAFGLGAAVKLFPTLFGAWLVRRRAWRAIGAAIATGVGVIAIGLLVFGFDALDAFLTHVVLDEMGVATFPHGPDPTSNYLTIRRQLATIFPGLSASWLFPVSVLVLTPVVAAMNWGHETVTLRVVGLLGVVLGTLIVFPLEPFYLVIATFPLVTSIYLISPGRAQHLLLMGVLVLSVPVTYMSLRPALQSPLLPTPVADLLLEVTQAVFGVVLLPMVGVWLVFAAGILLQIHQLDRSP